MGLGISIAVNGSPDAELAEAALVEVEESMGQAATYRLHYAVDISEGDLPLPADSRLDGGSELSILAPAESGRLSVFSMEAPDLHWWFTAQIPPLSWIAKPSPRYGPD